MRLKSLRLINMVLFLYLLDSSSSNPVNPSCGTRDWILGDKSFRGEESDHPLVKRSLRDYLNHLHSFDHFLSGISTQYFVPTSVGDNRWRHLDLTYRIMNYPRSLPRQTVDSQIQQAFEVWTVDTDLTFTKKSYGKVDIEISFYSGEHGDDDPFDGPGGILAHTFYPVMGGDIHLDKDERWVDNPYYRGSYLKYVAAHEIGHALGIQHISNEQALMSPTIDGDAVYKVKLTDDDIREIQRLYGRRSDTYPDYTPKQKEPRFCFGDSFESVIGGNGSRTPVVLSGGKVYKIERDGNIRLEEGIPVHQRWEGIQTSNPDSRRIGFLWKDHLTFLIEGSGYYRYNGTKTERSYPRPYEQGFHRAPRYPKAVFVSSESDIFFIQRGKISKFVPSNPDLSSSEQRLPRSLRKASLKGGFTFTDNKTYLMSDTQYWRVSINRARTNVLIDDASPPYPRPIKKYWFSCSDRGY